MNAQTCPSCNSPTPVGSIFCDTCGFDLRSAPAAQASPMAPYTAMPAPQPAQMGGATCSCGAVNVLGAQFCENCGKSLGGAQLPVAPQYNPPAAGGACQCGMVNVPGAQFCENCGSPLGKQVAPPVAYNPPPSPQPSYNPPPVQPPYNSAGQPQRGPVAQPSYTPPPPVQQQYGGTLVGRLVVQSTNASLPIPGKPEVIIGREDPVSGVFPDVNLDPYDGQAAGVGRQHARLSMQGGRMVLIDLDTVNGTFVNKQKLAPNIPHPVNNGDELRFGRMVTTYYAS